MRVNTNLLAVWLAQGFGLGRIPVAPGTFGSLAGLLWFALLISAPTGLVYAFGLLLGVAVSVAVTGMAEELLGHKDPSSVVLDEIVAVPICFVSWVIILSYQNLHSPPVASFFGPQRWPVTVGVFVAFRVFDVVKPWPVRQAQTLPGGFGVTLDDLLAALYVNVSVLVVYLLQPRWFI